MDYLCQASSAATKGTWATCKHRESQHCNKPEYAKSGLILVELNMFINLQLKIMIYIKQGEIPIRCYVRGDGRN